MELQEIQRNIIKLCRWVHVFRQSAKIAQPEYYNATPRGPAGFIPLSSSFIVVK